MLAKCACNRTRHSPTTTTTTSSINLIIKQHLGNSSKSYLHIKCTYFLFARLHYVCAIKIEFSTWKFPTFMYRYSSACRCPDRSAFRPACLSFCPSARPVIINGFTMTMCFNNKSISFIFIIPPTQFPLPSLTLWTLPYGSEVASWHIKFNIGLCVHRSPIIDAIWICVLIYA